jgi:type VI secretion system secreted protein Hcp
MKTRLLRYVALLCLLLAATVCATAATTIRITVTGAKQGSFKGDVNSRLGAGGISVLRYEYSVTSPRNATTGQATGKNQHSMVTITKAWSPSSVQFYQALVSNEVLRTVVIEFFKPDAGGRLTAFQTIRLTNASVAKVFQYVGISTSAGVAPQDAELEDISFTFQKIDIENTEAGKITATDDWTQ